jgi:hypothetical protein
MIIQGIAFSHFYLVDFEYTAKGAEHVIPICAVVHDLETGRTAKISEFAAEPPYAIDSDSLFVCYNACAELSCHLALGWKLPERILDLYVEFLALVNCLPRDVGGASMLAALTYFGQDVMSAVEKKEMQQLAMRGGPFTGEEMQALLNYCELDVDSLYRLLFPMLPHIDLRRAIVRGEFMRL